MRQRGTGIKRAANRAGMTLPELCVGLMITSMVLGALGGLWYAMGQVWAANKDVQAASITGSQAALRMESTFRGARYIFQWSTGSTSGTAAPASAFFWLGDTWSGASDGAVQVGELALLEHDPATMRIYLYKAMDKTAMSASQQTRAALVSSYTELTTPATATTFKSLDFVKRTVVGEAVKGLALNVPAMTTGGRPLIEFTLNLSRSGSSGNEYGSATIRCPTTQPL